MSSKNKSKVKNQVLVMANSKLVITVRKEIVENAKTDKDSENLETSLA